MTLRDMLSKFKLPRLEKIGMPLHDFDSAGDAALTILLVLAAALFAAQLAMIGHAAQFPAGRTVFM
jgi:hypothetical protein